MGGATGHARWRERLVGVATARWTLPVLVVAGLLFCVAAERWPLVNGYTRFVLLSVGINVILCASLNLVNGYMGEFSVGHAGFMSLGAYTAAVITVRALPGNAVAFPLALVAGGLVAAVVGLLLALLSFKTRGDYLAIVTLAFLMIVKSGLENVPWLGGPRGMLGIAPSTTLPWTFGCAVATIWVLRNLVYSRFGRAVVAIREDEIAANAMGVRTREAKVIAFVVSSFFAGVAGALFAHQLQFINPSTFDIVKSTEILVMVYLGGIASLGGSVVGAVLFTVLLQVLQPLGTWRMVILPLILVLLMLFRPRGILGLRELVALVPRRERRPGASGGGEA
jgi:branched-chain amino acid transport system permease protein